MLHENSIKCIITEQNEPLGCNFGNITEIDEVIKCLKGNMPEDIKTLVLEIGNKYLSLTGKGIKYGAKSLKNLPDGALFFNVLISYLRDF